MEVWDDLQTEDLALEFGSGTNTSWMGSLMSAASPPYDLPSSPSSSHPSSPSDQGSPNSLLEQAHMMMPVTEVDASGQLDAMQIENSLEEFVGLPTSLCMGPTDPLAMPEISPVPVKAESLMLTNARSSSRCRSTQPTFDAKPAKKITKSAKGKKKKTMAGGSNLENKMDLKFTKEEVRSMSCADLDRIVDRIHRFRDLTKEEEQEVRKQRRLIKNRESAAASRTRKEGMVQDLKATLKNYELENEQLRLQVGHLQSENQDLRSKLASLTSPASSLLSVGRPSKQTGQAAVCLFVVLLSFGLVFNQFDASPSVAGPLATALANYQMPQVAPFGRVVEHDAGSVLSLPKTQQPAPARRQLLGADSGYRVFVDEEDMPSKETAIIEPVLIKSEDPTITVHHNFNPNTTYITVLDGKQEGRPLEQNFPEDGSPFLIELIIPPESPVQPGAEYESSLEITCKVIETRLSTRSTMKARGQLAAGPGTGVVSVM